MATCATLACFTLLLATSLIASLAEDFVFNGFQKAANLSLNGDARFTSNGVLQLTSTDSMGAMAGHGFFASPVHMLLNDGGAPPAPTAVSFSTTFVFEIISIGNEGGSGMAFVVSPSKTPANGTCCPYLGLLSPAENNGNSSNHMFAVEFDTVQSFGKFFNDIDDNHVGVDVNSLASVAERTAAYYSDDSNTEVPMKLESGDPIQAWIDYDGAERILNVTIAPLSVAKPRRPLISHAIDLSPVLKERAYVGFSASTGKKLASFHCVSGWSFRTNGEARPLDHSRLPLPPRPRGSSSASSKGGGSMVWAISSTAVLLFAALATSIHWYLRQRAKLAETLEDWELDCPHRYPYKDLYRATKGFKESELLGSGGYGHVYKGTLPRTGQEVAIKRESSGSQQGLRQFVSEIASLGRLRHRNLVQLHGWCKRNEDLLLVYEYMPNGSLDTRLFDSDRKSGILSWAQRFKILKDIARGLLYLHEEWEQLVVHRDVKASNVLLDADMNGRLGDFGLARLHEHGKNPYTTHVVGTLGYIAPELSRTGKATASSDVFAYGALLLEVACGRRPIKPDGAQREMVLLDLVRECRRSRQLLEVVDLRLGESYVREEVELVLTLGLVCSQSVPELRPTTRQVTQYLNGDDTLADDVPLVFSEANSLDLAARLSHPCSSCGVVSYGSLHEGR